MTIGTTKKNRTALIAGGVLIGVVGARLLRETVGQWGFVMSDAWIETSVARGFGFTAFAMVLGVLAYMAGPKRLRGLLSNPAGDIAPLMILIAGLIGFLLSPALPYAVAGLGGPMTIEITGKIFNTNYGSGGGRGSCPAAIFVDPIKGPERHLCLVDAAVKRRILDAVPVNNAQPTTIVIEGWGNAAGLYPRSFTVRRE